MVATKMSAMSEQTMAKFDPRFVQVATVMDNRDPEKAGRIKVWINGSQSDKQSKNSWIVCRYASPFAGRTPGVGGASNYSEQTKSYGFWATPPDTGASVLVFFANGNIHDAYWFGCVYDHGMNAMVPGMSMGSLEDSELEDGLPITDYDRKTLSKTKTDKYYNIPLLEGLKKQNLLYDPVYGPKDHSANRQSPSTVYGMSTPRGQQLIIDDGYIDSELTSADWDSDTESYQDTQINHPANDTSVGGRKNEGIGLSTRSGAKIWLSEETGNIFVINRDGTCRIELTNEGDINVLAERSISFRAGKDINFHAGQNFNYEVMGDFNGVVKGTTKEEFTGVHNTVHHNNVIVNCDNNIRTVANDSIRFETNTTFNIKSVADTSILSNQSVHVTGINQINLTGGSTIATLKSHFASSTELRAPDFKAPNLGLVEHIHSHEIWRSADNHSDTMKPGENGGANASKQQATTPLVASDVAAEIPTLATHQQTVAVSVPDAVGQKMDKDLSAGSSTQTLEHMAFVMPCDGTVCSTMDEKNSGWTIQSTGSVMAVDKGTVSVPAKGIVAIDHGNGYTSVYKGVKDISVSPRDIVTKGQPIAASPRSIQFEIRRTGSAIYGKNGAIDPGNFYSSKTGHKTAAKHAALTGGVSSITNAPTTVPAKSSSELVTVTGVQSITSNFVSKGSTRSPRRRPKKTSNKPTTVYSPQAILQRTATDKTAIDWKVTGTEQVLIADFKNFEGTQSYQEAHGTFRNGKFYPYPDWVARGEEIIGYGHLVLPNESFAAGITEAEATDILINDSIIAANRAKNIAAGYRMKIPYDAQMILTEMVFQMGPQTVRAFRKFLTALTNNDYSTAAAEMRDSLWYSQTTKRAEYLARWMSSIN